MSITPPCVSLPHCVLVYLVLKLTHPRSPPLCDFSLLSRHFPPHTLLFSSAFPLIPILLLLFLSPSTPLPVALGRNQPLKRERPKWKSDYPMTEGQLRSKRDEFWDTAPAFEGRKEIWDALRAAASAFESNDHLLAQAILDGASITLPHGKTHSYSGHTHRWGGLGLVCVAPLGGAEMLQRMIIRSRILTPLSEILESEQNSEPQLSRMSSCGS